VRETFRQENARIYSEMYEEGIEPFRGTWMSITLYVLGIMVALAAMLVAFGLVVGVPAHAVTHALSHLLRR
jgi:hypothetical protein